MKTTTPFSRVKIGYAGYHTFSGKWFQFSADLHLYQIIPTMHPGAKLFNKDNYTTVPILY